MEYTGGTLEIDFEVMNRLSRQESIKIASVTIQWHHFLPGLRKVEDYIMATREEGVKARTFLSIGRVESQKNSNQDRLCLQWVEVHI